ncbi:hypothetical protein E8E12_009025 [Didymella heteroderae]|uniref:Uncharacterized protein n=1 Tax=Didymella heteroderae TaxID=1769908 RepID=A0A9P4WT30_9PLEO|nr:hypothetical protein E8E12_009025 [Didymella heteroderae]
MKINNVAAWLAFIFDSSRAFRISHRGHTTLEAFSKRDLPPPIPPRPAPRPPKEPYLALYDNANDDSWETAKCKGANFMRAMRGSDRIAGQVFNPPRDSAASEYENLDFDTAEKWGWGYSEKIPAGNFKDWGIDDVLRDLTLSDKCAGWGGSLDCLTFVHGFKQLADGKWEHDPAPYDVDGKTYRRSGAHYGMAFDASQGVIIALDRDSPQSAGKQIKPPVQGDELPAEIISRAIREVIPDAKDFPAWGGYDFDTDTPEGQALLGTQNAQAFSYFLFQHKATLGNLHISEVRVFRDNRPKNAGPNLLFIVKPVPAKNETKPSTEQYEDIPSMFAKLKPHQGVSAADTVKVAAKGPEDLPAPRPLIVMPKPVPALFSKDPQPTYLDLYTNAADGEWEKAKCKGANFLKAMKGSDAEAGKAFNPPRDSAAGLYNEENIGDLMEWGWSGGEAFEPGMKHYGVDGALRDMGSSDTVLQDGGDIRLVSFRHGMSKMGDNDQWIPMDEQRYEVNGKEYRYTGAWYNFAVDEVNGVIIATDRASPQDIGSKKMPIIAGDDLPLIRAFSDFAWIYWAALADGIGSDVKNIHYFMSLSITNELTQRILSRCVREILPGSWGFPDWPGFEFDTSTPQGQAILGTPNAQAFSYFLLQHKKELGNLFISKVRVFHDANWISHANLLLIVEPVPTGVKPGKPEKSEEQGTSVVAEPQVQGQTSPAILRLRHWWNRAKL